MIWRRQSFKLWNLKKKQCTGGGLRAVRSFRVVLCFPGAAVAAPAGGEWEDAGRQVINITYLHIKPPKQSPKKIDGNRCKEMRSFLLGNWASLKMLVPRILVNFLFSRAYSVLISACKFYWSRGVSCAHMTVIAVIIYGCIHAPLCHIFFKLKWSC